MRNGSGDAMADRLIARLLERAERAHAAVQMEVLRGEGLTSAQWSVLRELPGTALGMSELARRAGCQTPNLTPLVDRLARAGWLRRSRPSRDRRSVRVRLTPKGETLLRRVQAALQAQQVEVIVELSAEERRARVRVLTPRREEGGHLLPALEDQLLLLQLTAKVDVRVPLQLPAVQEAGQLRLDEDADARCR